MTRILSVLLSAAIVSMSVEPAFSQVRVLAAESAGAPIARLSLASGPGISPAGLSGSSGLALTALAPALAGAPSRSAASLPAADAGLPAVAAASPAAARAATGLETAAGSAEIIPAETPSAARTEAPRRDVASLETLARPAPDAGQTDSRGSVFFDEAAPSLSAPLTIAGKPQAEAPRLASAFPGESARAAASAPPAVRGWARKAFVWPFLLTAGFLGPLSNTAWASGFKGLTEAARTSPGLVYSTALPIVIFALWGIGRYAYLHFKRPGARGVPAVVTPYHWRFPDAKHFLTNLSFGVISGALATFLTAGPISNFSEFINAQGRFGILHWLGITGWENVVAYLVLKDLTGYFNHMAFHRIPFLWRFHKVHHTETDFEFSTYFRTHFGEDVLSAVPSVVFTLLLGPTILAGLVNEVLGNIWSQYQHINAKLPRRWETFLSRVIMTSEKHYIHHSMNMPQTNSNYSSLFSFWDRLFGTYRADDPATVTAGLENYRDPSKLGFWDLWMIPFRKEKKHE